MAARRPTSSRRSSTGPVPMEGQSGRLLALARNEMVVTAMGFESSTFRLESKPGRAPGPGWKPVRA
jgi:hypothetical protein